MKKMENESQNKYQMLLSVTLRIVSLSLCLLVVSYIARIPRELDLVRNGDLSIFEALYFLISNVLMLVAAVFINTKPKIARFTLVAAAVCVILPKTLPVVPMFIYLLFAAVGIVVAEVHLQTKSKVTVPIA
jgi:hypothetical protein